MTKEYETMNIINENIKLENQLSDAMYLIGESQKLAAGLFDHIKKLELEYAILRSEHEELIVIHSKCQSWKTFIWIE